ncbi:MAG: hypothetical protein M1829_003440 [Trizodia sp. TS-e1964]|nr:MAG: hypothetical protein M1829_003440 [Trizodia sp. TS-e1964]
MCRYCYTYYARCKHCLFYLSSPCADAEFLQIPPFPGSSSNQQPIINASRPDPVTNINEEKASARSEFQPPSSRISENENSNAISTAQKLHVCIEHDFEIVINPHDPPSKHFFQDSESVRQLYRQPDLYQRPVMHSNLSSHQQFSKLGNIYSASYNPIAPFITGHTMGKESSFSFNHSSAVLSQDQILYNPSEQTQMVDPIIEDTSHMTHCLRPRSQSTIVTLVEAKQYFDCNPAIRGSWAAGNSREDNLKDQPTGANNIAPGMQQKFSIAAQPEDSSPRLEMEFASPAGSQTFGKSEIEGPPSLGRENQGSSAENFTIDSKNAASSSSSLEVSKTSAPKGVPQIRSEDSYSLSSPTDNINTLEPSGEAYEPLNYQPESPTGSTCRSTENHATLRTRSSENLTRPPFSTKSPTKHVPPIEGNIATQTQVKPNWSDKQRRHRPKGKWPPNRFAFLQANEEVGPSAKGKEREELQQHPNANQNNTFNTSCINSGDPSSNNSHRGRHKHPRNRTKQKSKWKSQTDAQQDNDTHGWQVVKGKKGGKRNFPANPLAFNGPLSRFTHPPNFCPPIHPAVPQMLSTGHPMQPTNEYGQTLLNNFAGPSYSSVAFSLLPPSYQVMTQRLDLSKSSSSLGTFVTAPQMPGGATSIASDKGRSSGSSSDQVYYSAPENAEGDRIGFNPNVFQHPPIPPLASVAQPEIYWDPMPQFQGSYFPEISQWPSEERRPSWVGTAPQPVFQYPVALNQGPGLVPQPNFLFPSAFNQGSSAAPQLGYSYHPPFNKGTSQADHPHFPLGYQQGGMHHDGNMEPLGQRLSRLHRVGEATYSKTPIDSVHGRAIYPVRSPSPIPQPIFGRVLAPPSFNRDRLLRGIAPEKSREEGRFPQPLHCPAIPHGNTLRMPAPVPEIPTSAHEPIATWQKWQPECNEESKNHGPPRGLKPCDTIVVERAGENSVQMCPSCEPDTMYVSMRTEHE